MIKITRNLKKCSQEHYDLIIVGGGIYGVMLALESVRKNLKPLILEKNDFTGATSLNHMRTVHGGLRYLQSLDLPRFKESVSERKWFLKFFPDYVNIIPCLLPLYGQGLHRNFILRAGLMLNDILSCTRNHSVVQHRHLPKGRIISPAETKKIFPDIDGEGLTGSAVWYDAAIQEFQRLLMEWLKLVVASGATALNYTDAKGLLRVNNRVIGVSATDQENGETYDFKAPVVVNAAGPWCRDVALAFDQDHAPLFKKRLLLWNVLFKREALSDHLLGLILDKGRGHTYFCQPWKNRLLIGTPEITVDKNDTNVSAQQMDKFINDINEIVPGLHLKKEEIQRVYSGILPATEQGKLANREVIHDHGANGGPKGLFSISGVKFTTSRLVAEKTINKIFPRGDKISYQQLIGSTESDKISFDYSWEPETEKDMTMLRTIIENESVLHLSDLILRRTSIGDHPQRAMKILPKIKSLFGWENGKWNQEKELLKGELEF